MLVGAESLNVTPDLVWICTRICTGGLCGGIQWPSLRSSVAISMPADIWAAVPTVLLQPFFCIKHHPSLELFFSLGTARIMILARQMRDVLSPHHYSCQTEPLGFLRKLQPLGQELCAASSWHGRREVPFPSWSSSSPFSGLLCCGLTSSTLCTLGTTV